MSQTDQLLSSDISPEMNVDDVDIKHYLQCSSDRQENADSMPYTRTPIMEFKSSSSLGSNPDQTSTNHMSISSPVLNRHRKIGRQYFKSGGKKQGKAGGNADDGTESGKTTCTITPKVCWTSAADPRGDPGTSIQNNDPDWAPTNGSSQWSEPSENSEAGNETSRRVLAATAFVWLPLCRPTPKTSPDPKAFLKSDVYYEEAHRCIRLKKRLETSIKQLDMTYRNGKC